MDAAHQNFEQVPSREIVELFVNRECFAENVARPLLFGRFRLGRMPHRVGRRDCVDCDHPRDADFPQHLHRQGIHHASIDVGLTINGNRDAYAGHSDACVHRGRNPAGRKHLSLERDQVGSHNSQGPDHVRESSIADGPLEAPLDGKTSQKPLARRENRIHQAPQLPAAFHLSRQPL